MRSETCICGCSLMTTVTNAEQECDCGCECCGSKPKSIDEEVAQLRILRQAIENRLAELETKVA